MRRCWISSGTAVGLLLLSLQLVPQAVAQPDVVEVCRFADARLAEISGLTRSIRHPNILWAINDSSGGPFVYAVDERTCAIRARLRIDGAQARDFEAITSGRDERGRPTLWVGDIGDNRDSWPDVQVLSVREPKRLMDQSVSAQRWSFTYADRPHDAETLIADPMSPRLWIATKQLASGALVSLAPVLAGGSQTEELSRVGGLITDGAMSPDGSRYVLRDYVDARIFTGPPPGQEILRISLPVQPQGEAITWSADGGALLIASEGDQRLLQVSIPDAASPTQQAAADVPNADVTNTEVIAAPSSDPTSDLSTTATVALVVLVIAVLSAVLLVAERARRRDAPEE